MYGSVTNLLNFNLFWKHQSVIHYQPRVCLQDAKDFLPQIQRAWKIISSAGFCTVSRHCQARTADVGKVSALAFGQMSRSMRISSQLINP